MCHAVNTQRIGQIKLTIESSLAALDLTQLFPGISIFSPFFGSTKELLVSPNELFANFDNKFEINIFKPFVCISIMWYLLPLWYGTVTTECQVRTQIKSSVGQ